MIREIEYTLMQPNCHVGVGWYPLWPGAVIPTYLPSAISAYKEHYGINSDIQAVSMFDALLNRDKRLQNVLVSKR